MVAHGTLYKNQEFRSPSFSIKTLLVPKISREVELAKSSLGASALSSASCAELTVLCAPKRAPEHPVRDLILAEQFTPRVKPSEVSGNVLRSPHIALHSRV